MGQSKSPKENLIYTDHMILNVPKLNPIEAFPVEHQGEKLICLRDPRNISDKILYVSPETVYILGMFDGEHSVSDIRAEVLDKFGEHIDSGDIEKLINRLDEALFLESENFRDFKTRLESGFKDSATRPASHAGLSYPDNVSELNGWITEFFKNAEE